MMQNPRGVKEKVSFFNFSRLFYCHISTKTLWLIDISNHSSNLALILSVKTSSKCVEFHIFMLHEPAEYKSTVVLRKTIYCFEF